MLPKTLGESNRGTHIHSTAPLGDSSADTSPSLRKPYSPIGVDRTCETGELTWPGFFVEDFLAAMTEAFRYIDGAGKQSGNRLMIDRHQAGPLTMRARGRRTTHPDPTEVSPTLP